MKLPINLVANTTMQPPCAITQPDWREMRAGSVVRPGSLPPRLVSGQAGLDRVTELFPMRVNPYLLDLINSPDDAIGRQVIPSLAELEDTAVGIDPLCEERQSPAPQVIHRYPHRVVLLVSNQCAVHCRFCMRKRRVGGGQVPLETIERGIAYIRDHTQINEVILSGGDPLMRSDQTLEHLIASLRAIPHIRQLRVHTRMPAVLPARITPALVDLLSRFHPLYLNIHFNHPDEITPASQTACRLLADAGIPLGSQTVLLKGVNDQAHVLHRLFEGLMTLRVRPYYLHQLDRVPGTQHFRVSVDRGLKLLGALRGHLSGMAMPHYMIDLPGGGGKVALAPEAVMEKCKDYRVIMNWEGVAYRYPDEP